MTFFEWYYRVLIIQAVCIFIILSGVLAVKYFFKEEFLKVTEFYQKNIMIDTKISEVIEDEL